MNDMPYNTIKQLARQAINDTAKEIAMNVSQDFWVPRGIPMSSFDESIKLYFHHRQDTRHNDQGTGWKSVECIDYCI